MIRRDRCVLVDRGFEQEVGEEGGGDEKLGRTDKLEDEADAACSFKLVRVPSMCYFGDCLQ